MLYTLDNFPFSIIGITETWLHSISPDVYNLKNYDIVRQDRKEKSGGGVAFYIHEHLQYKVRNDISSEGSETLFIEIENAKEKKIIVGLFYRPPNSNVILHSLKI